MTALTFEHDILVPFADVDQAKVLYFPRIFHYCHLVMEAFFSGPIGVPYSEFLTTHNRGFPTVKTHAVYHAPVRYGLTLRARLSVRRIGGASVDLRFRFADVQTNTPRADVESTVVCIAMDQFKSTSTPPFVREVLERYLETGA